jgi:hypothetical protein
MSTPKRITVTLTHGEIDHHAKRGSLEGFVCRRLRAHGIPVNGMFKFGGVKTGVFRVKRLNHGGGEFTWWRTPQDALDDGVAVPDSPESKAKDEAMAGINGSIILPEEFNHEAD